MAKKYEWIKEARSPVYTANIHTWRANERRFRGGRAVAAELTPFDWEVRNRIGHYRHRQTKIVYDNYPARYVESITGHIVREDLKVEWDSLGDPASDKDLAKLFNESVDGTSKDASSFSAFAKEQIGWSIVTGHRWIFADSTREPGRNIADAKAGRRGFLSGISPTIVPDFHYVDGGLGYFILRIARRSPSINARNQWSSGEIVHHILMTRAGFDGFGNEFKGGGWWEFDDKSDLVPGGSGNWDSTEGEIPVSLLYYARDDYDAKLDTDDPYIGLNSLPVTGKAAERNAALAPLFLNDTTISRSGTEVLGQIASVLMDIRSAHVFDVLDGAKGIQWMLNVGQKAHGIGMKMLAEGSRWPALPPAQGGSQGAAPPMQIVDSAAGVMSSQAFAAITEPLVNLATGMAMLEALGAMDASGVAKNVTFQHREGARLADVATEGEQSFRTALGYLAARSGLKNWQGSVSLNKKFDLTEFGERLLALFNAETLAGIRSETADSEGMAQLVKELRIATDPKVLGDIVGEYKKSAKERTAQTAQLRTLANTTGENPEDVEP
jgi:hypothetical protein